MKLNDITSATLYLSFITKIKALEVLVLEIWQILEAPGLTDFEEITRNWHWKKCWHQQNKVSQFLILFLIKD